MIKCIASDMDGTLLNGQGMISEANVEAIKLAQQQGIEFLIATGRAWDDVKIILDQVGIQCPAICVNGAEVRDKNGTVIHSIEMNQHTAEKITHILKDAGIYFELYTELGNYSPDKEQGIQVFIDIYHSLYPDVDLTEVRESMEKVFTERSIHMLEDFEEMYKHSKPSIYKFFVMHKDESQLNELSEKLREFEGIDVTSSGRFNIEITDVEAQKGIALENFVRERGLSLSNTMALGDSLNDVSMLEKVGFPVAMGNAAEEIQKMCQYVTDTNDNDGVARAILSHIK